MNRVGRCRLLVEAQPEILCDLAQLAVHVLPLPDAEEVEILVTAHPAESVAAPLIAFSLDVPPELEPRKKVGMFIGVASMKLSGPLRGGATSDTSGADAGILDRQASNDDRYLGDAAVVLGFEQHSGEFGIDRNRRQLGTEFGQPAVSAGVARIDRIEFLQQGDAVPDRSSLGGIDERKRRCITEPERCHPEHHRGQIRSLHLGLGELRPVSESFLVIEPNRDARPEATAPPGTLVGRSLRDGLDRKPLDFGATVETGNAGCPRVDHCVNAGNGEGGLSHIGGQDDSPATVRLKDPLLFGGGEAGVQGQYFDLAHRLAQVILGLADLAFAGQEAEDVAWCVPQQGASSPFDAPGHIENRPVHIIGITERLEADLDREAAPRYLDDWCGFAGRAGEMRSELLRIDGG